MIDFRILFQMSPDLYLILGLDLKIIDASDSYLKATMTNRENVLGKMVFDAFPDNPDDPIGNVDVIRRSFTKVICQGIPDNIKMQKYDIRRPDGKFEDKYWQPSNYPIFQEGKVVGILHRAEDITEHVLVRQRMELERQAQERLFQDVKDYAIFKLSPEGVIETWNTGAELVKGYKSEEIIGKNFSIFYLPKEREIGKPKKVLEFAAENGRYEEEGWRMRKDGSVFWAEIIITSIVEKDGTLTGFSKLTRNLTERKKAEEALRNSEERYRAISNSANDAIIDIDSMGLVIDWNQTAEKLFGYSKNEALGKLITFIMPERYLEKHNTDFAKAKKTGHLRNSGRTIESFGKNKSGEEFPVEITLAIWNSPGGKCFSGIIRDITQRKKSEAELRLAYQNLVEVNEKLKTSNRDLEHFAYVASHDLQEPLRMVASFCDLLGSRYKGKLDERADKYISFAVDGAKRMQSLLNDLLQFSRVGSRGKELGPISAQSVLEDALDNLQPSIVEANAKVICKEELPVVMADAVQITQVFQNLLSNAIKFKRDDPVVEISFKEIDGKYQFSVKDNGIGIDNKHFDRLFVLFQRLHLVSEYPGTGIGLAICKKIIDRHGGLIWLKSEVGVGTTFYFTLDRSK